ncbi:MAG: cupin domain-containing protein [Balneolaceae bacterium]
MNFKTETYSFEDDGRIPNSKYPLVAYLNAFEERGSEGAGWLEDTFTSNNWTNTWRWGVYSFHHYHSNTHEVLGVFNGEALLHMGGESGERIKVHAGDILIIPAGVGHKCLEAGSGFTVVGAYPDGRSPDLNKGGKGERPGTDENISAVPFPPTDPLVGKDGGLLDIWGTVEKV